LINGFVKYPAPFSVRLTVKVSPVFVTVKIGAIAGALMLITGAFVHTTLALFVILIAVSLPFKIVGTKTGGTLHAHPLSMIFGIHMYQFPAFVISTLSFAALMAAAFVPPNCAIAVMRGAIMSIFGRIVQFPAVEGFIFIFFTAPSIIVAVAVG
jgi:hypothetical protein